MVVAYCTKLNNALLRSLEQNLQLRVLDSVKQHIDDLRFSSTNSKHDLRGNPGVKLCQRIAFINTAGLPITMSFFKFSIKIPVV